MDDNYGQSADDALEEARRDENGMFHPDTDEEREDQDNTPPASPADDVAEPNIPPDDPRLDSQLDKSEVYGEGLGEATDTSEEEFGPDSHVGPVDLGHQD